MIQKILPLLLTILTLLGCNQKILTSDSEENELKEIEVIQGTSSNEVTDTNYIENMISLHEYLMREQNKGIYSDERLQQIKDSINYDSIVKNRVLPVFN